MELCKKGQRSKQITVRILEWESEKAELLHKKEELQKAHEAELKEIELQLQSAELEWAQLVEEMNSLFEKVEVKEIQQEILDPRRPASRRNKHWSEEEKNNLKKCIALILRGENCSVHDLSEQLGINNKFCSSLISDMLSEGTIRKVMVTVALGVTATRKVQGYALALREVSVAEKAA